MMGYFLNYFFYANASTKRKKEKSLLAWKLERYLSSLKINVLDKRLVNELICIIPNSKIRKTTNIAGRSSVELRMKKFRKLHHFFHRIREKSRRKHFLCETFETGYLL